MTVIQPKSRCLIGLEIEQKEIWFPLPLWALLFSIQLFVGNILRIHLLVRSWSREVATVFLLISLSMEMDCHELPT